MAAGVVSVGKRHIMSEFGKIISVDPIVAQSLFGSSSINGPASAERELLVAVLRDAIECYWKYQKSTKRPAVRLYRDAKNWLFADGETLPFSFRNICDLLRLDPGYVRRGIIAAAGSAAALRYLDAEAVQAGEPSNIKRKLKSGRQWPGGSRLSGRRVRPLRVGSSG